MHIMHGITHAIHSFMKKLINKLERALKKNNDGYFLGVASNGVENEIAYELESLGLGAVYIELPSGRMTWFDLESMSC